VVQGSVCKILAGDDVKPHKVRYYQATERTDVPEGTSCTLERREASFESKMADVALRLS
jgi:hypothetical protein